MSNRIDDVPKRSHPDKDFVEHVCGRIDRYIAEQKLTDVEAAQVLGVRKQMIGPYRRGEALPGTQVLARACTQWGLTFHYRGFELGAKSLTAESGKPQSVPNQLPLPFDEPLSFRGVTEGMREVQVTLTLRRVS